MARERPGQLEEWEVALVKRMALTGDYNNQQIHAHFTRPNRSINQARVTEILKGERFEGIEPSSEEELDLFLKRLQESKLAAIETPGDGNPLDEQSLLNALQLTDSDPPAIGFDENDSVEWKQAFDWGNKADYAKTIVGLANRRGGYLVFGVHPDTKQLVGITHKRLDRRDSADITQFLTSCFSHSPVFDKREIVLRGFNIGAIYVYEMDRRSKPIICQRPIGDALREGDVFYRYPGLTTRIRYPELLQLLQERDSASWKDWMRLFERIEAHGVENVALLNTLTGEGEARGGKFLINESLLNQLSFIREGEFSEKHGAPTLKLIGELQSIGEERIQPVEEITRQITWTQYIRDFANQTPVKDPMAYVSALCHLQTRWLPIYYYIQLAKNSVVDAITILESEDATHQSSQKKQIDRLKNRTRPGNLPATHTQIEFQSRIKTRADMNLEDPETALKFLKATATLTRDDMELEYLLPLLSKCNELYHQPSSPKDLPSWIKSAACVIDYEVFGKTLYDKDSGFHKEN